MTIEVRALDNEIYPISDKVPSEFENYHIPGSRVISSNASFGNFLLQEMKLDGCSIVYTILRAEKEVSFRISSPEPILHGWVALKGDFEHNINGETVIIKESGFNFIYTPRLNATSLFKEGHDYVAIKLFYPSNFVLQQLSYFPALARFKEDLEHEKLSVISHKPEFLTPLMFDQIHQLLHSPYSPNVVRFHSDIMNQLLVLMLKEVAEERVGNNKYSLQYIESVHAAKSFIDSHLSHHYTIPQIASKVRINQQKLKKGFKEVFGLGVYGYQLQERLKIAKAELEQTRKSIKEISRNAGYKRANNFSAAFKKKYRIHPFEVRKNN